MSKDLNRTRAKLTDLARRDMRKGDYDTALRRYTRLLGMDSSNPQLYLKVAQLHSRLDRPKDAVEAYQRAAAIYVREAFEEKAVSVYRQALEIDPDRSEIYSALVSAYQRLGRDGDAVATLKTAVARLERNGQHREALLQRRELARLDSGDENARFSLARDLEAAGLSEEALLEYIELVAAFAQQGQPGRIPAMFAAITALKPEGFPARRGPAEELDDETLAGEVEPGPEGSRPFAGYESAVESLYRRVALIYGGRGS